MTRADAHAVQYLETALLDAARAGHAWLALPELGAEVAEEVVSPEIDCASRLSLCGARCCTMQFALTRKEVEAGIVEWNRLAPFSIARTPAGMCVHNDCGSCRIYDDRPSVCRQFDCRSDDRIWLDFDRRIPAPVRAMPGTLAPDESC